MLTPFVLVAASDIVDIPQTTSTDLQSGRYDGRMVCFTARIRNVFYDELDTDYLFALAEDDHGSVYLAFRTNGQETFPASNLVDATTSVTGLCVKTVGRSSRRHLFRHVIVHPFEFSIVHPSDGRLFSTPLLGSDKDLPPDKLHTLGKRRLQGRVISVRRRTELLLKTQDNDVSRISLQDVLSPPNPGDAIEVVGNVETDIYHINLSSAVWRSASLSPPPELPATNVSAHALIQLNGQNRMTFSPKLHGRRLRMRGTIRGLPIQSFSEHVFFVECDGITVPVDASSVADKLPPVQIGCQITIDGICWMEIENWRPNAVFPHIRGFTLVLDSPDGLHVDAHPPWWTPVRLLVVIALLIAVLIGILFWNRFLRNLVERRGRQLFREQIARASAELRTEERTRIAVELHDALSQNLTGIALEIKTAQRHMPAGAEVSTGHLTSAEQNLRFCREELRNCLWDLRSDTLNAPDMNTAIRQTLKPQIGATGLFVRFNVPRSRLSDNTTHAILKIVRELSVNAIRHGHATELRVAGSIERNWLLFSVRDNGTGFDPETAPGSEQGHFGLLGIRERIDTMNGEFSLQSAPGTGTKATVRLPIPQPAKEGPRQ